jgi:hypothetical protein
MKSRRLATAVAVLAATLGLSACGDKEDRPHKAETEGIYVTVGPLKYQVQISRQLNPTNIEDKDYLVGLGRFDRSLGNDSVWFAVFIRVENDGEKASRSAKEFELTDTQGNTFTPIELSAANTYAYRPGVVAGCCPNGTIPAADSGAIEGPTQGALLLFKLPRATLTNRPLELKINQPGGLEEGLINLDV